jgi:hypothetical protein
MVDGTVGVQKAERGSTGARRASMEGIRLRPSRRMAGDIQAFPKGLVVEILAAVIQVANTAAYETTMLAVVFSMDRKHTVVSGALQDIKANDQASSSAGGASESTFTAVEIVDHWRTMMIGAEAFDVLAPMLYLLVGLWRELMFLGNSLYKRSD